MGQRTSAHKIAHGLSVKIQTYLDEQSAEQSKIRKLDHPVRTVAEHCSVENRRRVVVGVHDKFRILDACVVAAHGEPVFFCEDKHLLTPFVNNMQRLRFFRSSGSLSPLIFIDIVQAGPTRLWFVLWGYPRIEVKVNS